MDLPIRDAICSLKSWMWIFGAVGNENMAQSMNGLVPVDGVKSRLCMHFTLFRSALLFTTFELSAWFSKLSNWTRE